MKLLVNSTTIVSDRLTGIERFASHISQELYCIDNTTTVVSSEPIADIPYLGAPWLLSAAKKWLGSREYIVRALWDQTCLRRLVAKHHPDVVLFPIQDGFLFPPVKQIVTIHDLHYLHFERSMLECRDEIGPLRTNLYQLKMPWILERSSAVVTVSESTKKDVVACFGVDPSKIHVVYNGYDERRFRVLDNVQPVLERYGLLFGGYFLLVGSILRHKNIVRLVQAFASLNKGVKLIIVGVCKDAEYLSEIKSTEVESGLSESRLNYLEYVPDEDLPYLYNGAIAFLLPSLHEGFGVPIIEAMACGIPVITSNCSAMPEVAGGAALLVDPYSVESIAAAMQEIIDNPHRAKALRTAGLERVKIFSWAYSAQKLYKVCKMVSES